MNYNFIASVIFVITFSVKFTENYEENDTISQIFATKVNILKQIFNPEPNFFGKNIESEFFGMKCVPINDCEFS